MKFPHWNDDKGEFELVEVKRIYLPKRPSNDGITETQCQLNNKLLDELESNND